MAASLVSSDEGMVVRKGAERACESSSTPTNSRSTSRATRSQVNYYNGYQYFQHDPLHEKEEAKPHSLMQMKYAN